MTQEERAALDLFLAFETQHSDHFSAQLFRLFQKADVMNVRRLSQGYPIHGQIYQEWMDSPTVQEFYDRYNVRANHKRDDTNPPKATYTGTPPVGDAPIPGDLREIMNAIGHTLGDVLNEHADNPSCFMLMVFDVGEGGTTSYISNAEREDVLNLLEEFVERHRAGSIPH